MQSTNRSKLLTTRIALNKPKAKTKIRNRQEDNVTEFYREVIRKASGYQSVN